MSRLILILLFSPIIFAEPMLQNDPKRPTAQIAHDLGITQEQFVECFNNVTPSPQGQHPSGAHQQMNKSVLLPCLQQYNPDITNEKLDQVMDIYRPEGPN